MLLREDELEDSVGRGEAEGGKDHDHEQKEPDTHITSLLSYRLKKVLVIGAHQKVFFIIAWFSADLVQCPEEGENCVSFLFR